MFKWGESKRSEHYICMVIRELCVFFFFVLLLQFVNNEFIDMMDFPEKRWSYPVYLSYNHENIFSDVELKCTQRENVWKFLDRAFH